MKDADADSDADINARIAARVRALRAERAISLEALSSRCGVSRSMISLIERGEASPTAAVLEKLGSGLGVTLAALFESPASTAEPLARLDDQPVWKDPESGYVRRNVSPAGAGQPTQIVEVRFPPGGRVAFANDVSDARVYQQVWMLEGQLDVTVGNERHRLRAGDCLAMQLDRPTMFHNPTRNQARYAVVITPERRPLR